MKRMKPTQMPVDEIKKRMFKDECEKLVKTLQGKAGRFPLDRKGLLAGWTDLEIAQTMEAIIKSIDPNMEFRYSLIDDYFEIHILN